MNLFLPTNLFVTMNILIFSSLCHIWSSLGVELWQIEILASPKFNGRLWICGFIYSCL